MDSQINIKRSMEWKEFETTFSVKLNQQQKEAVQSTKGPVLLLAVPGSGKTTVLVTRLGYMIYCRNIPPESILTVTYTVAATKDMSERFAVRFGEDMAKRLEFRTINGICAMIIQYYGRRIGKTPFELVKDEKATTGMLIKICQDHGMGYPTESDLKNVRTLITYIKNMMLNEEELQKLEEESDIRIAGIYREYCRQMREQKLMDYCMPIIFCEKIRVCLHIFKIDIHIYVWMKRRIHQRSSMRLLRCWQPEQAIFLWLEMKTRVSMDSGQHIRRHCCHLKRSIREQKSF